MWPFTVLMKQTRQAVRAVKQSIILRCLWISPSLFFLLCSLLALVTLGCTTQIGSFISNRKEGKVISRCDIADVFAFKLCQCKWTINVFTELSQILKVWSTKKFPTIIYYLTNFSTNSQISFHKVKFHKVGNMMSNGREPRSCFFVFLFKIELSQLFCIKYFFRCIIIALFMAPFCQVIEFSASKPKK